VSTDKDKLTYADKTCHSTTLSNAESTWTTLISNSVLRDENPTTNRLSDNTASNVLRDTSDKLTYIHVFHWIARKNIHMQLVKMCQIEK
jgi:hypothetical protein